VSRSRCPGCDYCAPKARDRALERAGITRAEMHEAVADTLDECCRGGCPFDPSDWDDDPPLDCDVGPLRVDFLSAARYRCA
jgi:hypothetical protein